MEDNTRANRKKKEAEAKKKKLESRGLAIFRISTGVIRIADTCYRILSQFWF